MYYRYYVKIWKSLSLTMSREQMYIYYLRRYSIKDLHYIFNFNTDKASIMIIICITLYIIISNYYLMTKNY